MKRSNYLEHAYAEGTHVAERDGFVYFSHRPFGDARLKGNQRKGMVYSKSTDGEIVGRCVKLDEHRDLLQHFKPEFDYQYPSISEVLTSLLTNNIHNEAFVSMLPYWFGVYVDRGRKITGSCAPNFLGVDGLEVILANDTPHDEVYEHYAVTMQEFATNVADCRDNQRTLQHLIAYYQRYGVSAGIANKFLLQQAGFDLLVGNTDRKQNMGNFVMVRRVGGSPLPINFDYGRCLPMYWTPTVNEQFASGRVQLGDEEFEQDAANDVITTRGGIFGNHIKFEENVNELLALGFQPFQIDRRILKIQLERFCHQVRSTAPALYWFAQTKANVLLRVLADPKTQGLWEDYDGRDF